MNGCGWSRGLRRRGAGFPEAQTILYEPSYCAFIFAPVFLFFLLSCFAKPDAVLDCSFQSCWEVCTQLSLRNGHCHRSFVLTWFLDTSRLTRKCRRAQCSRWSGLFLPAAVPVIICFPAAILNAWQKSCWEVIHRVGRTRFGLQFFFVIAGRILRYLFLNVFGGEGLADQIVRANLAEYVPWIFAFCAYFPGLM